jgi:hypothetical protein
MNSAQKMQTKRACLYCKQPISNRAHGLRKFCLVEQLSDGSKRNCKDEYHSSVRLEKMRPYTAYALTMRNIEDLFESYMKKYGIEITLEQVGRMGIQTDRYAGHSKPNGLHRFQFVRYTLLQIQDDKFKIVNNDVR